MRIKTCSKCQKALAIEHFFRDKRVSDGYKSYCKSCDKLYQRTPEALLRAAARKRAYKYRKPTESSQKNKQISDKKYRQSLKGILTKKKSKIRRRARGGLHTLREAEWLKVLVVFGGVCAYCGTKNDISIEHFIPISRGGGTAMGNVIPACLTCNKKKAGRLPEEWCSREQLERIARLLDSL